MRFRAWVHIVDFIGGTMVCPNCGKVIFEDSKFCRYCGHQVDQGEAAVTQTKPATSFKWETKDFVHTYPQGWMWFQNPNTDSQARFEFWQNSQQDILRELRKWKDEGWEPIGEVGPS